MSNQITWVEPDRPEIPEKWYIIVNGTEGEAFEDFNDYLVKFNEIKSTQENNINPFPPTILRWIKGQEPLYLPQGWLILDKFGFIWAFQDEVDFIYYSNLT
jgi:hypothetical protein